MTLELLLNQVGMTKYQLSKISGIPKTTILDICSGKSQLEKCSAKTVLQIAKALQISMEELMKLETPQKYDPVTNLPVDKSYLECGLSEELQESINHMKDSWSILDAGETDLHWDIWWCNLNADINIAELDGSITSEQAWHLREKYLRMEREN